MRGTKAEMQVSAEEFALGETVRELPELSVEIERVVAHGGEWAMPFAWMFGHEQDAVAATLADDPSVDGFDLVATVGDEQFYRVEWSEEVESFVENATAEGIVLDVWATEQQWNFRVLFPDRESLSRTYDQCRDAGWGLAISTISPFCDARQSRFGLTDEQQRTLALALQSGYYDVPRDADTMVLADELGISHQAVSERMRRAHETLVENTLSSGRGFDAPVM
ncbi:helix-turn-helix domain-containing protein [Halomicrococcus sp. SG-WS-1]|uniref:helix-turn-helix domain-containing protein n=1 Tax=Halomicrococcus sp. SG-WS-1 TaxID=3439057 RepID=UPI003F796331